MNYYKSSRPAEKIIDCDKINSICDFIEECGTIEYKAQKIFKDLVNSTVNKDAIKLLDGLEEEIVKNGYTSAKELSNAVWLRYRHFGIGGSDAASIMGNSKWRTILDLYYDKIGQKKEEKIDEGRQYLFDFGHAMEPFVAEEFARRFMRKYKDNFELKFTLKYGEPIEITACRVFRDTWMYRNPEHPFMIADLDFVVEFDLSSGKTLRGIFECKTTSPFTIADSWKDDAPAYYKVQINHYMTVMDYDFTVIACAADNSANNYYEHLIFRDDDFIKDMVSREDKFWNDVKNFNPPYEEGINNLQTLADHIDTTSTSAVTLKNNTIFEKLKDYDAYCSRIKSYNTIVKDLTNKKDITLSDILIYMAKIKTSKAVAETKDAFYNIDVVSKVSSAKDYNKFFRLLTKAHPELKSEVEDLKKACLKDTTPKNSCTVKKLVKSHKEIA